ncbi:hypothetical protein D3C78_1808350 [compost metagenome]
MTVDHRSRQMVQATQQRSQVADVDQLVQVDIELAGYFFLVVGETQVLDGLQGQIGGEMPAGGGAMQGRRLSG